MRRLIRTIERSPHQRSRQSPRQSAGPQPRRGDGRVCRSGRDREAMLCTSPRGQPQTCAPLPATRLHHARTGLNRGFRRIPEVPGAGSNRKSGLKTRTGSRCLGVAYLPQGCAEARLNNRVCASSRDGMPKQAVALEGGDPVKIVLSGPIAERYAEVRHGDVEAARAPEPEQTSRSPTRDCRTVAWS